MQKVSRFLQVTMLALSFVFGLSLGGWAIGDNILSASRIKLFNSGSYAWLMRVASNGQLQFWDNVNGRIALTIDDNTGGIGLRSRTSAQIREITPTQAGLVIYNSSGAGLCVSSGTGNGAWVQMAYIDSTKLACN